MISSSLFSAPGARVHIIGIGGSGMSGLAHLLLDRGVRVSGSDKSESDVVRALRERGAEIYLGHRAEQVGDAVLVAYSTAVREDNAERVAAREAGIPECHRSQLLAALMSGQKGILVSGMHGKTTTTTLLSLLLCEAGLNPSYYIGGEAPVLGRSARSGSGDWFVAEADESDGSFSRLPVEMVLVLNIEPEHLDYFRDMEHILEAFREVSGKAGAGAVYCADDAGAVAACAGLVGAVSYGFDPAAWGSVRITRTTETSTYFEFFRERELLGEAVVPVPGRHNVLNAAAALVVGLKLGLKFEQMCAALEKFRPARRRFDVKLQRDGYFIVDDYAHHPSEIRATLSAARQAKHNRIVALFQPHRYSRTLALKAEFGAAFAEADRLLLSDVYAASEKPLPGVSGKLLFDAAQAAGHPSVAYLPKLRGLEYQIAQEVQPGDCVITLGAGDIYNVADRLAQRLKQYLDLKELLKPGSKLLRNEPLSRHTTFRVGGPAELWCEPVDEDDFAQVMRFASERNIALTIIGRGSNLLVRDGGIRGLCVHLGAPAFSEIRVEGQVIIAGAGARLKSIVAEAKRAGLGGLEYMEGIPGNLGGALRMNAGAMGGWTFENVISVRCMNRQGDVFEKLREEMEVSYRSVPFLRENVALSARLKATPVESQQIQEKLRGYSSKRWESQPAAPSAGCIFKNPAGDATGRLIDQLGLKGTRVGGACVSDVHGNFMVNDGGATASDVLALISEVKAKVRERSGVELELEVIVLGEELEEGAIL